MGKNILVLDDDKQFCKLIVPVLEGRGHKVQQAPTAQEGAALIRRTPSI